MVFEYLVEAYLDSWTIHHIVLENSGKASNKLAVFQLVKCEHLPGWGIGFYSLDETPIYHQSSTSCSNDMKAEAATVLAVNPRYQPPRWDNASLKMAKFASCLSPISTHAHVAGCERGAVKLSKLLVVWCPRIWIPGKLPPVACHLWKTNPSISCHWQICRVP